MLYARLPIYENYLPALKRWFTFLFPVALLALRMHHTGLPDNAGMAWNLLLALIPLLLSSGMQRVKMLQHRLLLFIPLFIVWLLFLPNAPYMLTDLYHLDDHPNVPRWFDLILLLSFAWTGLVWGSRSLRQMEQMWLQRFPRTQQPVFSAVVIFLTGLGVYMGRVERFNSWDVLTQPAHIVIFALRMCLHPFVMREAWAFTLCFAGLLWIMQPLVRKALD